MIFEYKPHWSTDPRVDEARCRASVNGGRTRRRQCQRKPQPGSRWCAQHDPRQEMARLKKRLADYEAKRVAERKSRILAALHDATTEQLYAELERRAGKTQA